MIPTIETERLRLRRWEVRDFEPFAALRTNETHMAHVIGGASSREQAWEEFCAVSGQWALRGYGEFLVAERETDNAVGFAGLWHPLDLDEPELCWSLFPGNTGKGYATESTEAVRAWAGKDLGLPPLMSFIHPDNTASLAVADRLGATLEGKTEFRGAQRLLYRHRAT